MKIWILLLCASVLGTKENSSTAKRVKRLLKGAFCVGCFCVAVNTCYCILTPPEPQNGENALRFTSQIVNVASCGVFGLPNAVSSIAANISKKWFSQAEKNWLNNVNCSEDIYYIVDSDGKYVLRGNGDDYYEAGPKEVCTNRHNYVTSVPDDLQNYEFEWNVFYRYVQAANFKKCTPNPKSDDYYIMMCARIGSKETLGFCENYSTAIYLNVSKEWMYNKFIYFIRHRGYTRPIKFTEMQSSKDGFFYLTSDMSPKPNQYLQWHKDVRFDDSIYERLVFGQESEKIALKFEKVATKTPKPQKCKPTNKAKKEVKDKNNEDL